MCVRISANTRPGMSKLSQLPLSLMTMLIIVAEQMELGITIQVNKL